jgi:hypothetical protein
MEVIVSQSVQHIKAACGERTKQKVTKDDDPNLQEPPKESQVKENDEKTVRGDSNDVERVSDGSYKQLNEAEVAVIMQGKLLGKGGFGQ